MEDIKVSVIIPVYNAEAYLKECLDSILAQTLQEIEIICIDDGSTDCSSGILYDYKLKDKRIILLSQDNRYAGVARNLGMQHARGKYFSFLDADDFFSPFLLEKMYTAAEEHGSDVVVCNSYHLDADTGLKCKGNGQREDDFLPQNRYSFCRNDIPDKLFQITNGWAWDKLFSAQFIRRSGLLFSDTRTANDGYFVYMALARANCITKVDDCLVTQRINNKHSLSNTREVSWHCGFQMLYDIQQGMKEVGLYEMMEKTYLNFVLEYLIWSLENIKVWVVKGKIYQYIKEEFRKKIRIRDFPMEYYYAVEQYEKYVYIETHSFSEYMEGMLDKLDIELEAYREKCRDFYMQLQKKVWPFPYEEVERGSAIVLYGAGKMGQDFYWQISRTGYCEIVCWLDRKFELQKRESKLQGWREDINHLDFDKVVIALLSKEQAYEAMEMLKEWGIPEEELIWKAGIL